MYIVQGGYIYLLYLGLYVQGGYISPTIRIIYIQGGYISPTFRIKCTGWIYISYIFNKRKQTQRGFGFGELRTIFHKVKIN